MSSTEQVQGQAWKSRPLRPRKTFGESEMKTTAVSRLLEQPWSQRLFTAPRGSEESSEGFGVYGICAPLSRPQ